MKKEQREGEGQQEGEGQREGVGQRKDYGQRKGDGQREGDGLREGDGQRVASTRESLLGTVGWSLEEPSYHQSIIILKSTLTDWYRYIGESVASSNFYESPYWQVFCLLEQ